MSEDAVPEDAVPEAPVRILHIEDSPADAELALRELRKASIAFEVRRVETREALLEALEEFHPDLILSDYRLPNFDGMQSLRLVQERAPDVPVIITTGSTNEDTAVACMRAGAADYVLKDSLGRLAIAVRAALEKQRLVIERRKAEEVLHRSEAELRKLWRAVEQSPATVVITDLGGRIEYVNPRFTEMTGYTAVEALGQNPRILKSGLTPPQVYVEMWKAITSGRVWQGELCNKRKDGTLFWESASISPVRDERGATTSYVAVKEDITDRRRAAENLAKSEAYFRSLIESSFDLTAVLSPEGHLRYASPSVERILGYKSEELVGRFVFDFIHAGDRERAGAKLRKAVTEWSHETIEVRFSHKDGSWRTLSVSGSNLPAETGMTGLVINARDVTDRLQLEAQYHQAQKMEAVGRLAGGVAHDFNNLLTVIQGYGELLEPALEGDPELHGSVVEIVKAAERSTRLTRQLLAFSRHQVLETHVIDIGVVVADIERMLKRLIGEDIEVVVKTSTALGHVMADPGQIEQVVLNLAVNARDAMPAGGRLTIGLANTDLAEPLAGASEPIPSGRYVVLSVADTGCGMDAETLGHIFEPFFTTKEKGKGTGLGLATVYGIVRQTGGYVAVETAPGAGTIFRIYLPRSAEEMNLETPSSIGTGEGTETVLLVEDEVAIRTLAKSVLERRGYKVIDFESGAAAIEFVTSDPRPIHVLLTDVILPKMNGVELASRVLVLRPSIKVVFMSGYTADVLTGYDFKVGQAFITKPFSGRTLAAKIREVLDTWPA